MWTKYVINSITYLRVQKPFDLMTVFLEYYARYSNIDYE